MEILFIDGVRYNLHTYKDEPELEKMVVEHCKEIFGENALYFDKQTLETGAGIRARTDGFVISLDLNKWYILEVELSRHSLYEHIVPQITKFHTAYKSPDTQRKISRAFDDAIKNDPTKRLMFELKGIEKELYRFLSDLVESKPVIVIPIDYATGETKDVCEGLPFESKIIEFKTFVREGTENAKPPVYAHLFEPLYEFEPDEGPKESSEELKEVEEQLPSEKPRRAKKGEKIHQREYRIPILETLREVGGSGRVNDILERVEKKMKDKLTSIDYEKLLSGTDVRWMNTAKWERNIMKNEGLLKKDSPSGTWEITDKGRDYYSKNR